MDGTADRCDEAYSACYRDEVDGPSLSSTQIQPSPEGNAEDETRLNVRLSGRVKQALDWIASIRGVSNVEAVRRAIGTERFFLELREKGARIYVKMPVEKDLKEVVFTE